MFLLFFLEQTRLDSSASNPSSAFSYSSIASVVLILLLSKTFSTIGLIDSLSLELDKYLFKMVSISDSFSGVKIAIRINKKGRITLPLIVISWIIYFLGYSSETVSFFLPFARRAANTLRPLAVAIRSRNPCLFFLFLFEGWNVLFIVVTFYYFLLSLIINYL